MIGQTISHYRVLEKLGAGGMGEVYRATDSKLGRDVALKVLPPAFARDTQRMSRFQREAQVLASLNHPNIAAIYGLEESAGARGTQPGVAALPTRALVMELVEGPTLAERIRQGALPLDEALPIAKQIAEALEYAHERGIVHRDLKPANVKVTADGKVKVLDFGLAKALSEDVSSQDASHSPTLSMAATKAGIILGTAAYMSPEQARGKPVDRRADIWAFGVVLYEMLTGRQAYTGETGSDILAKVLEREPNWDALPPGTPPRFRELLRRCLAKDSKQRLQAMGEARIAIEETIALPGSPAMEIAAGQRPSIQNRWLRALPWGVAAVLGLVALAGRWQWRGATGSGTGSLARVAIPLSPAEPVAMDTLRPAVAISPDGKRIVYVADHNGIWQLYVREMDQGEAKPIPGTEGGCGPFFSPDGRWLGYFDGFVLKKISLAGGAPLPIAVVPPVTRGATWGPDGTIYFTSNPNGGVSAVPGTGSPLKEKATGGSSNEIALTMPDPKKGENSHRWPEVLPGGQAILFTLDTGKSFNNARIAVLDLKTGQKTIVLDGGTSAHYAASGHLVFARGNTLMAAPFSLAQMKVTGDAVTVATNVATDPEGAAQFDLSADGTLVYVSGSVTSFSRRLIWVSRDGAVQQLPTPAREFMQPTLSPDGRRVALTIPEGSNYDIWISDVERGNLTRLTFDPGEDFNATWAPNGKRVTISSELNDTPPQLLSLAADGSGTPERLIPKAPRLDVHYPGTYSPDGRMLVFGRFDQAQDVNTGTGVDIWVLPLEQNGKPRALLESRFNEFCPILSPDGRWLAYVSDETGREEVYVMPFPGPGGKVQVSTEGGTEPIWNRNGRELFYRNGNKMMDVAVRFAPMFSADRPKLLFEKGASITHRQEMRQNYDISPDGKRFLMIQNEIEVKPAQLEVVLNWFDELRRLVQGGKKP